MRLLRRLAAYLPVLTNLNRALGVREVGFTDGAFCVPPHRPVQPPV